MKIFLIILASIGGLSAIAEIGLRLTMGLGNPPLYIADEEIGYLLAPQQKLRRFGNLIEINQYSMRNPQIQPQKENNTERVLVLGDSVVKGFWRTKQAQTIPAMIAQKLQKTSAKQKVEVLNASANSWAPRNELAYLKRFGLFDADTLVLVINTDDLFSGQPSSLVVGEAYNYPAQVPPLALIELYQLSIAPPKSIPELERLRQSETNKLEKNLAAIKEIKKIAEESDTKFVLAITPLLSELKQGETEEATAARKSLQELAEKENIEYIDFLQVWSDFPQPEFLYSDRIHPNLQGNTKIADRIAQSLN